MIKAVLNLNTNAFAGYQHLDLEKSWRDVNVIRLWLKARGFDLSLPIFVTKDEEDNTLTFFQTIKNPNKTLILVHPNPKVRSQLQDSLKQEGHVVHAFSKVKDANLCIFLMSQNGTKLDRIIVPKNLKVFHSLTYKTFLNRTFPKYGVLTVDNKEYRDYINMNLTKDEYMSSIFNKRNGKCNVQFG